MLKGDRGKVWDEKGIQHDFNAVQSAVMSRDGSPNFKFVVFDAPDINAGYVYRVNEAIRCTYKIDYLDIIDILKPRTIKNEDELLTLLEDWVEFGFEGVMIRDAMGIYKQGRSTVKEGILLKLKKFHDDEGVLVDIVEKMHNANPLEKDELGYAKRSSKKINLVAAGTSGSLVVKWSNMEFSVGFGPGITDVIKQEWWDNKESLIGKYIKFSYQELSKDGVPRFGKALGFRHEEDM